MNNIIKRVWNQNRMVTIEDLRGMAFQAEDGGHTFEISGINDAGESVPLSGTVAGVFMRPDGTDVALTGTASDGVVSVTLSDACYAVAGRFGLTIFVTADSKKTCVYACIGTVAQTSYGTVAGDTPQDVVDLINAINAAVATIPADYTDLMAAIAPTYSDQSVYPVGAYRWYDGILYKSKVAITTAESFTAAHWETVALADDVSELQNDVSGLKSALHISERTVTKEITTDVTSTWESGYISTTGTKTAPHQSYDYSEKIDVIAGDVITFGDDNGMRYICAYDSNGAAVSAKGSSSVTTEYTVPADIVKIAISCSKSNADHRTIHIRRSVSVEEYYVDGQVNPTAFFVSTTGDDDNEGLSASNPKATINSALESGAESILMFGGVYAQTIDLTKCQHPRIRIASFEKDKKTVIKAPDAMLIDSATQVSGYTKVYSATCDKTFDANNIWIFQDGIADATTEITDAERHPLQRGYQYRCSDTKIAKCSSSSLSDALAEIETADDYRWYLNDGTLYFSAPTAVSANNPICWSSGAGLFSGNSRGISIEMVGIDVKYLIVNLNDAMSVYIENCSSGNVYGNGCFTYDGVASARFTHCEAYRGFKGTNGDGFNAHGVTTGDTFAHQLYGLFIDCWAHDNRDDGVSDHERGESAVIGGLYEYNRFGGGITPSYGSHCTCNGVYCRKNGDGGFLYMDSASVAEGGVGGQLICYNCVAEENTLWPEHTPSGFKINGDNNRAILVNCKSIGQDYGYYISNATSYVKLIDCGTQNCEHATGGRNDNFTKIVTTIVQ